MPLAQFGFVGLGVMGHMLALNMERQGFTVAGYDLDEAKLTAFETQHPGKRLVACRSAAQFTAALEKPRRIMLMVPAGKPVDSAIAGLLPFLEAGDVLIDGGNTFFTDTERRALELEQAGIIFIGAGVSGGEMGALWGPSIMPGGPRAGWDVVRPYFEAIAARVDGEPCVSYIGPRGAGHYVKMVHNGIEYGDMQLIAEAYDVLHRGLRLKPDALQQIFLDWNTGELESYLIEITAQIFSVRDSETGQAVLDLILDEAQQKGTGKWTSQNALDIGAPVPTINAALEARLLSALKAERQAASHLLTGPQPGVMAIPEEAMGWVKDALYAAKICSYAQGFSMLSLASREYGYALNLSELARIWRGGCIIRARFLNDIRAAFNHRPDLPNLLVDDYFSQAVVQRQAALRQVVTLAVNSGIPVPGYSSALAYYDAYRSERLPANLTQAQRDFFGAHTYRRLDREGVFHTEWNLKG